MNRFGVYDTYTSALKRSSVFGLNVVGNVINEILMLDHIVSECALFKLAIFLPSRLGTILTISRDAFTAVAARLLVGQYKMRY
jgi:hypothetical protein